MQLSITQVNDTEAREFRKFVNSLRCPLCNSQLDGNIHPKEAKLYCVSNNDEYYGVWRPDSVIPRSETIKYYYPQFQYIITINLYDNQYQTEINRYNMDVLPMYRNTTRKTIFSYHGDRMPFFRKRMEEDVFLNKLKLYNVFS